MMDCEDLYDFFEVRSSAADELTGWNKFRMARAEASKPKPVKSERTYLDDIDDVVAILNYDRY